MKYTVNIAAQILFDRNVIVEAASKEEAGGKAIEFGKKEIIQDGPQMWESNGLAPGGAPFVIDSQRADDDEEVTE